MIALLQEMYPEILCDVCWLWYDTFP